MTSDPPKQEDKPETDAESKAPVTDEPTATKSADSDKVEARDVAQPEKADKTEPAKAEAAPSEPVEAAPIAARTEEGTSTPPTAIETPETLIEEPRGWWPLAVAAVLPIVAFFLMPMKSGLWDPYELNVADLSRRFALNVLSATGLSLSGTDNSLPHLNDLGRPELEYASIALGFKLFDLHVWAGRAPLAAWGVLGVLATYAFVARLVDRRAGVYAAVILTAMPLYFVQARTMLGDIVTMSALAISFGGLAVAVFDRDESGPTSAATRLPWLGLGLVGLAAGFGARGGLLGLAVPLLGIGLAWALTIASSQRIGSRFGDAVGLGSLVLGLAVFGLAWMALSPEVQSSSKLYPIISMRQLKSTDFNMWIGAAVKTQSKYPTFDYYVGHLGPALAPWSAFAPFAVGRLLGPPVGRRGQIFERESMTRMALLVGTSVALVIHAFMAQKTDLIAFCAPALVAAICAVALRDYERGAMPSVAVAVGTGMFLAIFHHDFHELPEKAYQAYAVGASSFPDSFKDHSLLIWTVALVGFAGISFLTWVERDATRAPFDPKGYLHVFVSLREAWDGLLALVFLALVAGSSVAGLSVFIGNRMHAHWLSSISLPIRDNVLNLWWITAFAPLGAIFGVYFACDVWLWAFGRSRHWSSASWTRGFEPFEELYSKVRGDQSRGELLISYLVLAPLMTIALPAAVLGVMLTKGQRPLVAVALAVPSEVAVFLALGILGDFLRGSRAAFLLIWGAVIGFILCFNFYPALANQVSPKEIFESYEHLHSQGEPLALLGVGGKTSAYYAGGQPATFTDSTSAFNWLVAGGHGHKRYLATKSDDLAKLNQLFRERSQPRINVPVVDGRSSQILLMASALAPGEKDQNPLDKIILTTMPEPQHKLNVNMEDKLEVVGYDIADQAGNLIDYIAPGRKYRMRTYYRVLAPVTTEWEAFIHIDGYHRRHNGDHKPMDGKYPMALWLTGDMLVDDYEIGLEPNFTPGSYTLYFGLFVGETRLKVKSGPSDGENRIDGGPIRVQ